MWRVVVVIASLVLAACDSRVAGAKKQVADLLKDPNSAQFQNVKVGYAGTVCGEVNGKNAYGAYVGFKRFMVSDSLGIELDEADRPIRHGRWLVLCEAYATLKGENLKAFIRETDSIDALVPGR